MKAAAEEEQLSRDGCSERDTRDTEASTITKPKTKETTTHLPLYTVRQPPLVQPLETSPFAERTIGKFGLRDLGHEWVTLFQTIGESNCGGYSKSMKLSIPDTILLSPSGYSAEHVVLDKRILAHQAPEPDANLNYSYYCSLILQRVTPHSILDAFFSTSFSGLEGSDSEKVVAIRRVGFQVELLTLRQLKGFCHEMEHPCIVMHRNEWEDQEQEQDQDPKDQDERTPQGSKLPRPRAFCLQRHIPRDRNTTFLTLWRCKHRKKDASDNVTDKKFARSFYKRPLPLLTSDISSKCDLFLVLQRDSRTSTNSSDDDEDDADSGYDGEHGGGSVSGSKEDPNLRLTHLDLESKTLFEDSLRMQGFDEDVILPQLYHMKLTASEILNRLNRGLQSRQACGILCEFFVGALDKKVYFSGLVGTHWEGGEPSWKKLSRVDAISRGIAEFLVNKKKTKKYHKSQISSPSSHHRHQSSNSLFTTTTSMFPSAFQPSSQEQLLGGNGHHEGNDAALRLYNELNPRFPSVESPYVSEMQWRYQSPLLPPDISPRYIGAQVPKSYRDGKFHSLLTPKQADSVNRLNLSPRPPAALIAHYQLSASGSSLLKKQQQYGKLEQLGRPPPQSPRNTASSYKPVVENNGTSPRQFSVTRRAL